VYSEVEYIVPLVDVPACGRLASDSGGRVKGNPIDTTRARTLEPTQHPAGWSTARNEEQAV
jgi:hypothetical protein